jgi:hypothetical protein
MRTVPVRASRLREKRMRFAAHDSLACGRRLLGRAVSHPRIIFAVWDRLRWASDVDWAA